MPGTVAERILALLAAADVEYLLHEHVPVRTVGEARARVPELTVDLLKTVAFAIEGTTRYVLAAVPAEAGVDYKALARALGCNRRALRLMPPARVEAELGFEVGGIGPFPVRDDIEVVIDAGLAPETRVRCGAGLRTLTLELPLAALARASAAQRVPIARPARA